ncbi:receptor-like protein 33 [Magnolia sinica]|uniref:receptor-like protein 33 n=1 Tax=Magnolia sinica TaxID=86752 RepID=UPI00265B58EA|nr:receptor-like protein 33 [Magnolia sinica]
MVGVDFTHGVNQQFADLHSADRVSSVRNRKLQSIQGVRKSFPDDSSIKRRKVEAEGGEHIFGGTVTYASNYFNDSPIPSGIEQLTSLTHLNLSFLSFYGQIPLEISRLTTLVSLDLSYNSLQLKNPSIRAFVQNLSSLRELHLSWANISVQGSEWGLALSSALPLLRKLSLSSCRLSGPIHPSLSNLHFLSELHLSGNYLFSVVPNFIGNFSSLTSLRLRYCILHGKFPESIFMLPNLQTLHVGYNPLLTGEIPPNNTLRELSLSDTGFCSNLRDSFTNSKLLTKIQFSDCNLTGQFPSWLVKLEKLMYLDLSYNGFSGPLPSSLFSLPSLREVHLRDNQFSGQLVEKFPHLFAIVLFCNCTYLQVLDLSHNRFSGSIPPCLGQISNALIVLNLGGNAFHGPLLQTFKEECTLETLDLNGNHLEGQVPSSLARCKKLEVLNLGNNQIHDTYPFWIENLSQLHILILRSNKFHGTIGHPQANHTFPLLQIFDLCNNSFTGKLPSNMLRSWKAMMETKSQSQFLSKTFDYGYYQDKVTIVIKGQERELVKILIAFTVVDLSNNQFHGDIPESAGNLKSLVVLNMSCNHFTGRIPASLGNIKALESLDLSHNSISGEIPWQLTKLNFLAVLDLSENFLIGSIPQGPQFNTFTNKSFLGNSGLCGTPLSKKCEHIEASPPLAQSESKYDWKSMWIGFGVGYGVGMGILFWTLALWTKGMKEFTIFVDRVLVLIFPCEAFILMHPY